MTFEQDCRFPAIVLYEDGDITVDETYDGLTLCRKIDIKAGQRGRFAHSTIIDSNGIAWRMDGAEKLHGVGAFWGYNLLLSQRIRARPKIVGQPKPAELEIAKAEVIKRLKKSDALTLMLKIGCTTIDIQVALNLIPAIERAASINEIINVLLAAAFPERQRWESAP